MEKCNNYVEIEKNLSGQGLRIGIVMSRFNIDVCEGLLSACACTLRKHGVVDGDITLASVPGALEIPTVLQKMAKSGKFDALVALGAVVRGETYHFELVSNESARGVLEVQLETGVPVANGILTTSTEEQALVRAPVKGADAARVAVEMANLLKSVAG